ncbi:MAG: lytic transglycosylase [Deltaproteobacteria bacterium]|nr:MAG: lytic transglycosylase [Deltaproteobacteria bacterium]
MIAGKLLISVQRIRNRFLFGLGAVFLWIAFSPAIAPGQGGPALPAAQIPDLLSTIRGVNHLTFCNEPVPLDDPAIRERFEKELLLILWNRPQAILWMKRSTRCFPFIEKALKKNKLPDDLKYLAVAESALRPHARSGKSAVGYWQFVKSTGKKYGLRIDRDIDERRNLAASTRAAMAYFKALYAMFGSWSLSAAAYNMGEQGLQAEILVQETDDYYRLYLPLETQRYIFRILAIKLILENPRAYGFAITPGDLYPPRRTDSVSISSPGQIPLQIVAQAARSSFKTIKDLNPQIRGHYLVAGTHTLLIPEGSARGFKRRLEKRIKEQARQNKNHIYIVHRGDTLTNIAKRFNVPLPVLLIWNRLNYRKPIHPGDRLIIHPK